MIPGVPGLYPGYQISGVPDGCGGYKSITAVRNSLILGLSIAGHLSFQRWSRLLLHTLFLA